MECKVFDAEGNERDWAWAVDRYGVRLVEADPPPGATVFRLTELRQKVGPCGMTLKVVDKDGTPCKGIAVLQGWVDGAELPDDAAPRLSMDVWGQPLGKPNKGNGGMTNVDGIYGWGWGSGEQYDPATQEGAHWYWVMPGSEEWYSDVTLGYGWLFGSDHDTLNMTWTRMVAEEEPEPKPGDDFLELVRAIYEELVRVVEILETVYRVG